MAENVLEGRNSSINGWRPGKCPCSRKYQQLFEYRLKSKLHEVCRNNSLAGSELH